jgi:hypothetical protein
MKRASRVTRDPCIWPFNFTISRRAADERLFPYGRPAFHYFLDLRLCPKTPNLKKWWKLCAVIQELTASGWQHGSLPRDADYAAK